MASGGTDVVVFDVNETLSDLAPIAALFADVGAPGHLAKLWFASLLRDGFALTAAGAKERFAVLGEQALRVVLHGVELARPLDEAVDHVMTGFGELDVHPDVPGAVRALRARGLRLVTLSNGAAEVAQGLLQRAGLAGEFERILSVEDAPAWKPDPRSYAYAAHECGLPPERMLLVAAHPWDVDGAARAGLRTAFVNRQGVPYPVWARPATATVASLTQLVTVLATGTT
jgi:2-haloacid dehalogenase